MAVSCEGEVAGIVLRRGGEWQAGHCRPCQTRRIKNTTVLAVAFLVSVVVAEGAFVFLCLGALLPVFAAMRQIPVRVALFMMAFRGAPAPRRTWH